MMHKEVTSVPSGKQHYKRCVSRANTAGLMILCITLFQYGLPAAFLGILRLCGTDTSAAFWGLTTARYLLLYLLLYLLMTGLPLWLCRSFLMPKASDRRTPKRLSADRRLCLVLFGVALCVLANIFASFFSDLLSNLGLPLPELPAMGDGTFVVLLFDLLVFALIPAVMEEYLLRGIVLTTLRPLGDSAAVVLSAILFGLLHGNLTQAPYACLIGLILGSLYVYTDSLHCVIAVHALSNTVAVTMSYLRLYTDSATASLWGLVILIVVLMSGGVACMWLWRHPLAHAKKAAAPVRRALFNAPLLWLAIAVLLVIVIIRTVC